MLVSIAICTWNRAGVLEETLAQFRDLVVPVGIEWELVVVNNNCTDRTDEVISAFESTLPIRRIFEPVQGIAAARNASRLACRGEYTLCMDDDIRVSPDWLASYVAAFRRWPQADFFGGPVLPYLEPTAPAWAHEMIGSQFGANFLDSVERPVSLHEAPYAGNMAVRTEVLRHYRFDTEIGRKGHERLAGEETKLFVELMRDGRIGIWVPSTPVRHLVLPHQLTPEFMINDAYAAGRTQVLIDRDKRKRLLREHLRYYLWTTALPVKAALERSRKGKESLGLQMKRAWWRGFGDELATQRKRAG